MSGHLISYKDDSWRGEMGRHTFSGAAGFTAWPDSQNDRLSSFRYKLPVGWDLRIHEHRSSSSRFKAWRGANADVVVNKDDLPGYIHDQASGHSWVKLNYSSIQQAFDAVQPQGPTRLLITKPSRIVMPAGYKGDMTWHQQGIQKTSRGEFVVSGSAPGIGYLYFTDYERSIVNVLTPAHGNFNHLGGFQVAGNFLAVGYERYENKEQGDSKILFYDIANIAAPVALEHLTITRSRAGDTAGAVGLIALSDCWLALVANWNAARLDFYTSTSLDLRNNATRFSAAPIWSWSKATHGLGAGSIDNTWGAYQNINLFRQAGSTSRMDDLWFVGMHTDRFPSMEDWADLYHLNLSASSPVVTKKSKKHYYNSGGGQRFVYASSFYYDTTVKAFEVYSAEAHISDGVKSRVDRWI